MPKKSLVVIFALLASALAASLASAQPESDSRQTGAKEDQAKYNSREPSSGSSGGASDRRTWAVA